MTSPKSPAFTNEQVQDWVSENYDICVAAVHSLASFEDQNFRIDADDQRQYVLKIHSPWTRDIVLDLQNDMLRLLSEELDDFCIPDVISSSEGQLNCSIHGDCGERFTSRLLTFLPGTLLASADNVDKTTLGSLGKFLGIMDRVLKGYFHPGAIRPDLLWDVQNAQKSKPFLSCIQDPAERRLADFFLLRFEMEVLPMLHTLRHSVVHNDAHRQSVLVESEQGGAPTVAGLIDFGDSCYTATICNVAVAAYDAMLGQDDPISAALSLIAGYNQVFPIREEEVDSLYYMIAVRLSIYACMSARAEAESPDNQHAQRKRAAVRLLMEQLVSINPIKASDAFRDACGLPSTEPQRLARRERTRALRTDHFGQSVYTHYASPLRLIGGGLQYLYDDEGRAYLDCVNNVCQWGHCHPRIVRAAALQGARLNTNSRYLYDTMTEYAERLTATMPEPLSVCFFVNSGSEANDLAIRLAKAATGGYGVIVLDAAYHGNSTACTEISPHRIDRDGRPGMPTHVRKLPVPDVYRGLHRGDLKTTGSRYAAYSGTTIEEMVAAGLQPAAFIAESLVGTGGQFVLPDGYLQRVYATVRAAGGVCIADEVQVGFGRTGKYTWCFEWQDVVPDIVTIGKPIGNGHPMAAVVTTREIANAFDSRVPYFNTFGGNPVSCAVGLAVLDVLESEGIRENVVDKGEKVMDGLRKLQEDCPNIGDVRGLGLYIGVEIVKPTEPMVADAATAAALVEHLKKIDILVNTNGYENNVIKIKPPLIVHDGDVNRLLAGFAVALGAVASVA